MTENKQMDGYWVYRGGHHVSLKKGGKIIFTVNASIVAVSRPQERILPVLQKLADELNADLTYGRVTTEHMPDWLERCDEGLLRKAYRIVRDGELAAKDAPRPPETVQ